MSTETDWMTVFLVLAFGACTFGIGLWCGLYMKSLIALLKEWHSDDGSPS